MKPVRRPIRNGCEMCIYRVGEFEVDEKEPQIIRCFCRARFVKVDSELMNKDGGCDFYSLDPSRVPEKKDGSYGI